MYKVDKFQQTLCDIFVLVLLLEYAVVGPLLDAVEVEGGVALFAAPDRAGLLQPRDADETVGVASLGDGFAGPRHAWRHRHVVAGQDRVQEAVGHICIALVIRRGGAAAAMAGTGQAVQVLL